MASSKIAIANIALGKLGSRPITSLIQSGSNEASIINEVYDDILEEVLAEHPWSFAQKRSALDYVVPADVSRTINGRIYTPVSISAVTKADPAVVTATDHGLVNGDRIKIVGVVGMTQLNNNFYRVANKTRNTFELINEDTEDDINSSAYTTYSSGGQIQFANESNPISITSATVADPVVITSASHGLVDGDWIKILGVNGMTQLNGNFYIVANAATNTFELTDTDGVDVDGLAYSAYVSGGQILVAEDLPFIEDGAVVVYQKPADLVKPNKKSLKWALLKIEDDKLLSNVEGLKIIYTFLNQDTTRYFPKFVQALATRLAAEIAFAITNSTAKSEALTKLYYDVVLPTAVSTDSTQGTPDEASQDEWLDSMITGSGNLRSSDSPGSNAWHPI